MNKIPRLIKAIVAVNILFGLLAVGGIARGQTLTNPIPATKAPTLGVNTNVSWLGQLGNDFVTFFKDANPYFTNGVRGVAGVLYNESKWGGFVDAQIPIAADGQISMGFATAYIDKNFYDASLSIQLGTTWNIPWIGKVYTYAETGPGYNFQKQQAIEQSFIGAVKRWDLWKGHEFGLTGGWGNISDRSGQMFFGAASLSF